MGQRGEEILVDGIPLAIDCLFHVHLGFETAALFGGIGEFAEAVGEFDAAGIELEAFGEAIVALERTGESSFFRGVFAEEGQLAVSQLRLDMPDQNAAEDVGPAIVVSDANAGRLSRRRRACRVCSRVASRSI